MSAFRAVVIGNESLAIQCGEMLREAGHAIAAVVTRNADVADWAETAGLHVVSSDADLVAALSDIPFDWLLSIANLDMIPDAVLALPARGAVNFHDGPLPRYAGLNAPVWALLAGEVEYGISWHMISGGVDEGGLLAQSFFDVTPDETVLTLNTKCYAAAIDSFGTVIEKLSSDAPVVTPQDLSQRSYFAKNDRPANAARLDFNQTARKITTLVHALDHGDYWNPLSCPKIATDEGVFLVGKAVAEKTTSDAGAGTVIAVGDDYLTVATATAPVTLRGLRSAVGDTAVASDIAAVGDQLPAVVADETLNAALKATLKYEAKWRKTLEAMPPATLPQIDISAAQGEVIGLPLTGDPATLADALRQLGDALSDDPVTLALAVAHDHHGYLNDWVPVAAGDDLAIVKDRGSFAADLCARIPGGVKTPALGLSEQAHIAGTALTVAGNTLFADTGKIGAETAQLWAARLSHIAAQIAKGDAVTLLPDAERQQVLYDWNATETDYPADLCIHQAFEAQVARTPDAEALAFEGESLTYGELNNRANALAHLLRDKGVGPDVIVGLHLRRSAELLIGALAIMKAGGAYLPMDPAYPADRTALYIEDSGTKVIVTDSTLAAELKTDAGTVLVDALPGGGETTNPDSGVTGAHLAYMIYTSGSTGRPKGVMVEHRNVSNFFTGMDDRIAHDPPGVWMAVTSLSFDISVLELFWTLARGFKLVISGDENRALVAGEGRAPGVGMDFSLFYWGNDDGIGRDKYRSLLEGAQYADKNGFCAVWTPERHFHAFGGPYPNPSVTGAAVAAVTQNLAVRAGSCVAPLHHTARIAEEWAVIDNLTNGRTGLAIASGWQPDDFVLRPENTPPKNKPAMFDAIRDLRRLWEGETVEFPRQNGEMHGVVTQPRPVSKKLNVWVTTAGNPETWKEAGTNGCNVLTHLLGQSVDEVAEKIVIYHDALRAAGHNPDDFTVTLMLHSFLSDTRDHAREIAREPMKDYLRAAAGLIKQYAWAFPAFKKPKGVENPMQIDLGSLDDDEMDGILEFAFERYFNDSGLFGTVEDAIERVKQVKAIGVTEVACLIDYGIDVDLVLEGLKPLAEVVAASNQEVAQGDYSIAAQILRHKVTHLQCTPSMAQMLTMNDEARVALSQIKHMMVGGEALPGALADELRTLTGGHVENMYGPTETTIWSTTQTAEPGQGAVPIGTPIANTQVYVLDDHMQPTPIGVPGELYIGGAGVTRGYFQRDDLTAERFLPNPFAEGRMYRTGDLVRWRADGRIDFLGRADFQVKLRGYRVELGEIESVIDQHEPVQQSVVIAREDTPGVVQLVGYLLADGPVDEAALRVEMSKSLPDYMVPRHFVTLDAFPLTPNKKVDRKALPAPVLGQAAPVVVQTVKPEVAAAPVNLGSEAEISDRIAAIWSAMLGVPQIGPKDSFFDLGGHSLLAVQAHREIRSTMGVQKLSITDIFRAPTLGALAKIVAQKAGGDAAPAKSPEPVPAPKPATPAPVAVVAEAASPAGDPLQDAMARRREMRERRRNR
ncbi:LLM class flavin-dependent oxidoreductase [Yoonia sp. F2084L]|uniref:MupA/Atu3671 family FMN-dependent luciferase-like monooxygenase n=1 Tax=Yoonia sp. F2084L TaxID=2926419 RepID=UPI001FF1E420|nr:MupA/Atu3671 family FMN-dependent luciferase-like monooxygenase [Yoonia sp. F2084L]MCK0093987.1 LLM class flavin-dependent oxidoreductase [Yoonia sp. F2084L]